MALSAGVRAAWLRQAGPLAAVTLVVFLLVLFRQLVGASPGGRENAFETFALSLWRDFYQHLLVALAMLAMVQFARRAAPASGWPRGVTLVVAVALAAAAGTTLRMGGMVWAGLLPLEEFWRAWLPATPRFAVLGGLLTAVGEFHRAEVRSIEAARAADGERAALEQQTMLARLRTLEAQVEPHFLFNTLATVRRLYEVDAAAGEAMLDRLMRYLAVALPSMRDDRSTLEREVQLLESYLELQRVRMGRRLAYGIEVPPALRDLEVPPMMLLTLVENSIKHGLAPRREGGRIDVRAEAEAGHLLLEVADTGEGFGSGTSGGGTGLANLRARLAAMYGAAAQLTLSPRAPHGLRATIRLPRSARCR